MTDIYYPHEYIPGPTYDNYGFEPIDPMIRTDRIGGLAVQRRKYTSVPTNNTVVWQFKSDAHAQVFESWYRDVLTDGAAWFYMKCKTPVGLKFLNVDLKGFIRDPHSLNQACGVIRQQLN